MNTKRLMAVAGFWGMLIPWAVYFFGFVFGTRNPEGWYMSISATYYSNAMMAFLVCMGISCGALIAYNQYTKMDDILSSVAGACGIILALFPCELLTTTPWNIFMLPMRYTSIIHYAAAFGFFGSLTILVGFYFTKSKGTQTTQKMNRNRLYKFCAIWMGFSIAIGFGFKLGFPHSPIPFVWIGEALALQFFGIAWLTKGGVILKDEG